VARLYPDLDAKTLDVLFASESLPGEIGLQIITLLIPGITSEQG
jgi:hypothetical protein